MRPAVGYRRFEGLEAAVALAGFYRPLRLFVNYFQPSFKLAGKMRVMRRGKLTPVGVIGVQFDPPFDVLLAGCRLRDGSVWLGDVGGGDD